MRKIKLWIIGTITRYMYDALIRVDDPYMVKETEDKLLMDLYDNPAINKYFKQRIDYLMKEQVGSTSVPSDFAYHVFLGRRLEIMEILTKGKKAKIRAEKGRDK